MIKGSGNETRFRVKSKGWEFDKQQRSNIEVGCFATKGKVITRALCVMCHLKVYAEEDDKARQERYLSRPIYVLVYKSSVCICNKKFFLNVV